MGGSVPGNIPYLTLIKWCEVHSLSRDEMIFLDRATYAMDAVYRDWYVKKMDEEKS